MKLGRGDLGPWHFTTALSADFSFSCDLHYYSCDYAFLWLNKSRHGLQQCQNLYFCDSHYVTKSVHLATGKQETDKEAQVCNEFKKA